MEKEEIMGYIGDDDFINNTDFHFDDFCKQETLLMSEALEKINDKLYSPIKPSIQDDTISESASKSTENYYNRYRGSEGYSAHSDGVDDKEIIFWRSEFPYLRIEGKKLKFNYECISTTSDKIEEETIEIFQLNS